MNSDNIISKWENAVLISARRRNFKHYVWIIAVSVLIGVIVGHVGTIALRGLSDGGREVSPAKFGKVVRNSEGALCSEALSNACIYPSGEVRIPSGKVEDTLAAYFALREHIPGAEALGGWSFDPVDRDGAPIQTREVADVLNATDTLLAMIQGTGLILKEVPDPTSTSRHLWIVRAPPANEGAPMHEHREGSSF